MSRESDNIVAVRDLRKRYGRTVALDGIDLEIQRGQRYAILGPNGAGKTTLIHILCTILQPDAGSAIVDGFDVVKQPRQARRRLGVVFQEPSLDTRLTVGENLEFHGRIFGVPHRTRKKRIAELLDLVELGQWKNHVVRSLSKGMQRRLEIARALIHDSTLLILDEPTVGLDAQTRSRMWEYLKTAQSSRELTVLVTTHYIEEVDDCDTVCIVDNGKILVTGDPNELKREHGAAVVHIEMNDEQGVHDLCRSFPEAKPHGRVVHVPLEDPSVVGTLLAEFGNRVTSFTVSTSTLEGVFLDMTGRSMRDVAAGVRERAANAPRPGGEPIR